jgi:uncharacterized protein YbjT (DUF2867 family)
MHDGTGDSVQRAAVVAGATGLVGREVMRRLLAGKHYGRVVALARRPLALSDVRLVLATADFERLDQVLGPATLGVADIDVFCCLGTTISVAGSEDAFRRVDRDYVVALGRWAAQVGARRMIVVSAIGADAASRAFYNRVKGEMEHALVALNLRSLVIVRPSLLSGQRAEFRLGERVALAVAAPLRKLIPAKLRPISAADVAQAMIDAARATCPPGVVESAQMQGAAKRGAC